MYTEYLYNNSLAHHGIKGQKWGERRFQNPDGSLTPAGKARYNKTEAKKEYKEAKKQYDKDFHKAYNYSYTHSIRTSLNPKAKEKETEKWNKAYDSLEKQNKAKQKYKEAKKEYKEAKKAEKKPLTKEQKIAIGVAAVAATGLAAYGVSRVVKNKKSIDSGKDFAKKALQDEYIAKNIANTQSHIDPTRSVRNNSRYQHAYGQTLKSRENSIWGDRKFYGPNAVKGRNASEEARNFVDNSYLYKVHRGGMYGWS